MFAARGNVHRNLVTAKRDKEYNKQFSNTSVNEDQEPKRDADGVQVPSSANNNNNTNSDGSKPTANGRTPRQGPKQGGDATTTDENTSEAVEEEEFKLLSLDGYTGSKLAYLRACNHAVLLLRHHWFNSAVMLCISWASLSVGFQTYPSLATSVVLDDLDLGVLSVFILEAVLKIMAEGLRPWVFFTGKEMRWNCFDFGIIIMSLPMWGSALGGGNIAILRMLRLMRIMKLVKRIPQLYMIVMGLIGGLKSIGYILLLLFLVFYLYAISGMYAWKDNDAFHFRNVPIAMVTLFRMSTLENWSNVRAAAVTAIHWTL